jgi:hypothetical protein
MASVDEREIEFLLDDLCVEHGFCLSEEARARLLDDPPGEVDTFTDPVIAAEGLDPVLVDKRIRQPLRARVARSFGLP